MAKNSLAFACAVFTCASVAGCATPKALYQATLPYNASNDAEVLKAAAKGAQVVNLPVTRLTFAPAPPKENKPDKTDKNDRRPAPTGGEEGELPGDAKFVVKSAPVETDEYFRIWGASSFWSDTNIQITRLPNTDIVSSIQVDFRDDTPARIQQVFGLLSSVAGAFQVGVNFFNGEPSDGRPVPVADARCAAAKLKPFAVDVTQPRFADLQTGLKFPDEGDDMHCWVVTLRPLAPPSQAGGAGVVQPQDVVTRATFVSDKLRQTKEQEMNTFPYAACLTVEVTLANPARQEVFQTTMPIIDPRYLRLARLPKQGKIEMHPVCNANQSNKQTGDPLASYFDAIDAVLKGSKPQQGSKGGKTK